MMHIVAVGGLCNRMRAIDSAIALASDLSLPLNVYWQPDRDLNCPFDLLFEPISGCAIHIYDEIPKALRILFSSKKLRNLLNTLPVPAVAFSTQEINKIKAFEFRNARRIRHIFVKSYSRFYDNADTYRCFTPTQHLKERIQERTAGFDQHVIGVHVRRTDNAKAIANSPDVLFMERMQEELLKQPLTRFYLATDSMEVKDAFVKMFGDRIMTTPFEAIRSTVEGMQEALVELYTLATTSKILGSYWSSYSTTAGELGNIEIERLQA